MAKAKIIGDVDNDGSWWLVTLIGMGRRRWSLAGTAERQCGLVRGSAPRGARGQLKTGAYVPSRFNRFSASTLPFSQRLAYLIVEKGI